MNSEIPNEGAANEDITKKSIAWWSEMAAINGVDLTNFDPTASLEERTAWAISIGLFVGAIYARFSSKMQKSTEAQVLENIQWAAKNGIYVPPEYISADEAVKGKRVKRDGIERTEAILSAFLVSVLLIYKASRLFRQAGKGYQFVNEKVVEEGMRAILVSQGIDTDDRKTWKLQMQVHGMMDDMLLDAIADHVRSGLKSLFMNNLTTGAIGVGYRRKEIPGAPPTNRGLPRTMPEVDPDAAELIREHAQLLLDGVSVREGCRRWVAADGPYDPRSSTKRMNPDCYRKLFTNPRLTGEWEFGRKRNEFSSKLDNVKQVEQPDDEVTTLHCEELRILDDKTFHALVAKFDKLKTGPRGPRKEKKLKLWDLTTEFFLCESCSSPDKPIRFYQVGAKGLSMQCKNGDNCKCKSSVRRQDSVEAVCAKLTDLISSDAKLVESVILKSQNLDAVADHGLDKKLVQAQKKLVTLTNRVNDLFELSGEGTDADRKETKARLRAAQSQRNAAQGEVARLQRLVDGTTNTLSVEQIRERLSEMSSLLSIAATGELGDDAVYKALSVFRLLTGGKIWVTVEKRANRKRTNIRGTFQPNLVNGVTDGTDQDIPNSENPSMTVWLRKPPRLDLIAERVHVLIDIEGMSFREAAKQLRAEGHNVNSGNVWYSYRRWYEMQGLELPSVPYNNGKERRKRA